MLGLTSPLLFQSHPNVRHLKSSGGNQQRLQRVQVTVLPVPRRQSSSPLSWPVRASPPEASEPSTSDSDDLLIERQIANRRPKANKGAPTPPPGSYKVISAARDSVYGDAPLTPSQQFEGAAVSFLAFVFVVILGEGVFLAASGFLSEDIDRFAQDFVYPAFSPSLVFFLACSSAYGLWKTGGGRKDEEGGSSQ